MSEASGAAGGGGRRQCRWRCSSARAQFSTASASQAKAGALPICYRDRWVLGMPREGALLKLGRAGKGCVDRRSCRKVSEEPRTQGRNRPPCPLLLVGGLPKGQRVGTCRNCGQLWACCRPAYALASSWSADRQGGRACRPRGEGAGSSPMACCFGGNPLRGLQRRRGQG